MEISPPRLVISTRRGLNASGTGLSYYLEFDDARDNRASAAAKCKKLNANRYEFRNGQPLMANPNEMYDAAVELKDQGDLEGAIAKLNEILATDPNHVLTHSALAVNLQKLGKLEEAVGHARKVTEIEPDDAFSFTQLSVIFQRCGLIQEAEDAMAQAQLIQRGEV